MPLVNSARAEECFLNASKLKSQGKLEDAINQYKAALNANPEYMEAAYNLGNSYRELGNPGKAIESWRRVIEIDPTFKDAHVNLGVALRSVGQLHDAIQHHRTALDLDNECIEACVNLGVALATRKSGGDCNHARTFYDRAIDLDPDYKPAHFNKGLLMVHEMELSLAEHCFNEALAIDPSDPLIQLNLAQLHLKINQNEWALAQSQARAETPMERAAQQLSYKNADKGHQDDAEHKRLVEETSAKLFDKEESMERLEMAFVGFSTVIAIDEDCAAAHAGIAMVHLERGETEYAEHLFQQVIQRWPDNLASHTQLAEIKQDSQRNTEAIPHWEVMLEHNDEDRPTRNFLGRTYKKIGNVEKALHHYKKANALDPDFSWWFK